MKKIAIIIASHQGVAPALIIHRELPETELFYAGEGQENPCTSIDSIPAFVATNFTRYEGLVFIGALGICVRAIAPCIHSKYTADFPPYSAPTPSSPPKATTTTSGPLTPFTKDSRDGSRNPSDR